MTAVFALSLNDVFAVAGTAPWTFINDLHWFRMVAWGRRCAAGSNISVRRSNGDNYWTNIVPADHLNGAADILQRAFLDKKIRLIVLTRVHGIFHGAEAISVRLPPTSCVHRSPVYPADQNHSHAYHFELHTVRY